MLTGSLGRYRIVSQLGRGSMGTVYQAHDPVIERTVALKTLNPELPEEAVLEMKARFLREAKSAGRLNHPNVVTIYDVGIEGGLAYIAMEYLEGQSLRQLLDSGAKLSCEAAADIVAQIAEGLDYAGRFGIVHRDIKPANIMVSPAGLAKLTDFGVAYVPSSQITRTGDTLGSPRYMSPEQVQGQAVDRRADIFSLGVVLYEMLLRKTPYERPNLTLFTLMELIVKEPAPRVSEQNPEIPPAFDAMLARALAKRPEDRYQRASQFAGDLRQFRSSAAAEPGAAPAQDDPALQEKMAKMLADLETFSRSHPKAKERQGDAASAQALKSASALSEKLHQAYDYLKELVRQFNQASPPFNVEPDLIFLGRLPAMALGEGAAELQKKRIEDKDVVDKVTLTYRLSSAQKARISVNRNEAQVLRAQLEQARLGFDHREIGNGAGALQLEAFLIECDIAASATLSADYAAFAVEIECQNVGVLGRRRYRLGIAEFDAETISDFGKLVLGFPSRFAGLRLPA